MRASTMDERRAYSDALIKVDAQLVDLANSRKARQ